MTSSVGALRELIVYAWNYDGRDDCLGYESGLIHKKVV